MVTTMYNNNNYHSVVFMGDFNFPNIHWIDGSGFSHCTTNDENRLVDILKDSSVLVSNGYPLSFLQKITKTRKPSSSAEPTIEYKSSAVFKSETTLRSHLLRPKDAFQPNKQDGVVYRIPCECGKFYIGETGGPMQDRIKEHEREIRLARTQTGHANNTGHNPLWNEVRFIDRDPH